MQSGNVMGYETILKTVRRWPAERRFALVQDVLNTLKSEATATPQKSNTLERALGLLATDRPAPSDAEIEKMLDERRMERYG